MTTIGVDFHTWSGIYQGSRSHILGIYKCAIDLAPHVNFIFFGDGLNSLRQEHEQFRKPNVQTVEMRRLPGPLRLGFQLPYLSYRYKLDYLHCQYRIPLVAKGRQICTIHDTLVDSHPQYFSRQFSLAARLMFRYSAVRSHSVLTVSDYSRLSISSIYGIATDKVSVTPNGVDHSIFKPGIKNDLLLSKYGLSSNGYWLSVGRIEPRKNHLGIIRAWRSFDSDRRPLVIVGQRDFGYDAVEKEILSRNEKERLIFLDSVTNEDLAALYANAYCLLYPSFAEGFGMPVIEALASGCPVITSDTTSLPEVGGACAIYADPTSVDSIVAAMSAVDSSDISVSDRVKHSAKFSWESSAAALLKLIDK